MLRSSLVKVLVTALVLAELRWAPEPYAMLLAWLTALLGVAFLTWAVMWPSAQFFVPSQWRVATDRAQVFLTFDDGPDPRFTPAILDVLARHRAHATFFIVGARAAAHPEVVRRIAAEGHAIGTHTHGHALRFHFSSPRQMRGEIERGIAAVAAVTGRPARLFRPPQGLKTPMLRDALSGLGLECVTWSARGFDTQARSASQITERLERWLRPGAIVTLHDGAGLGGSDDRSATVEALDRLLTLASERGLHCDTLTEPSVGAASAAAPLPQAEAA